MVDLVSGLDLRGVYLLHGLRAEGFKLLLVGLGFACADITTQPTVGRYTGAFFRFDKEFEVGFGIRLVADFRQQKRIDVSARGDEVQIAADAGLGWMDVAKVVRAIDDPEFLVAGGEIQNLFILGQDDERRKSEFGVDGNNVLLRVLHDTRRSFRRGVRGYGSRADKAEESEDTENRLQRCDA